MQIDVVANHHQRPLLIFEADAPRGVGEDHGANPQARENANGERHLLGGIPFVEMHSSLHSRDRNTGRCTDHHLSRMSDGGGARKEWNVRVWDARSI